MTDGVPGVPGGPEERTVGLHELVSRIVAACHDSDPVPYDETDGVDVEVCSLIVEYLQAGDARLAALLGLGDEADDGEIAAEIARLRERGALSREHVEACRSAVSFAGYPYFAAQGPAFVNELLDALASLFAVPDVQDDDVYGARSASAGAAREGQDVGGES